ncbi:MAG: carboxypeptidase [Bdellovibrionales bacterium RIFCSPHIGHO2_01_FULL_40_29]|nr:MAG: carboxypeptidase [Bdellovibrionales bacterium RIFCSPHIGHO2_01_FULL_40_29]OFZ34456.1 MAG: carboxypeptidase [Bdellovibrionales bacterium RIFCSPHIGHO2_02_FULL_40_15]
MINSILSLFLTVVPSANNYDKVTATLTQIQQSNPGTSQVINIGTSDKGVPIYALQVGSGQVHSLIVATHHGNEYGSTAVALGVAENLAKNPIPGQTVFIVPVLNIAGYNSGNRYESGVNGSYDANRDYPGPCRTGKTFNLKSTKALADFLVEKDIQISATLHTFWPAVVYPWGISTRELSTPYDSKYIEIVKAATEESRYQIGNNTEVLYAADGTFEDYAYWKHGIWSLLFELGFSHNPDQTAIKNMVDVNIPGIRRFLTVSPQARVANHTFTGRCDARVMQRLWLE